MTADDGHYPGPDVGVIVATVATAIMVFSMVASLAALYSFLAGQ